MTIPLENLNMEGVTFPEEHTPTESSLDMSGIAITGNAPVTEGTSLDMSGIKLPAPVPDYSKVFEGSHIEDSEGNVVEPTKVQAFMYNAAYEGSSIYRGIKQWLGLDSEALKQQEEISKILLADPEVGKAALAGSVTGMVAEPVGFAIPSIKGAKLGTAVARLAAAGTVYGAGLYVEEGRSRTMNAIMGGTIGTAGAAVFRGAAKAIDYRKLIKASKTIDTMEKTWAEMIYKGYEPRQIPKLLKTLNPTLSQELRKAGKLTGRNPALVTTKEEAKTVLDYFNSSSKLNNLSIGKGMDSLVGIISTRIGNISPSVKLAARNYERNVLQKTHDTLDIVNPFLRSFKKTLTKDQQTLMAKALANGDAHMIEQTLREAGGTAWTDYLGAKKVLEDIGDQLFTMGRITNKLDNYFPRMLKDREGLYKALGITEKSKIDKALTKANSVALRRGYPLTPLEESEIINNVIRGFGPGRATEFKPGFAKQRRIQELPDEWMKFYESPAEALHSYIRNATIDIEKFRFFGKDIKFKKQGNLMFMDLDESIGSYVAREVKKGNIDSGQETELIHLLKTRFGTGEKSAAGLVQDAKNYLYSALLGNPIAAASQLGDLGVSIYMNGFKNSLRAVVKSITGKSVVNIKDYGLMDHIAEEFANTRKSAKFLKTMFKLSLFTYVDKLGKETLINSALTKYQGIWSKTGKINAKLMKKFSDKYADAFGPEDFNLLVGDLKAGKITDRVKAMLFSELSDTQPITRMEMPEMYLALPNGRVVYMLKTFMLKQLDIIRREGFQEIKKGNVGKGMANLMKYGIIVGSANAGAQYVKDAMLGKDIEPKTSDIGINLLKTFGWSEYVGNKLKEGKIAEAAFDTVLPPFEVFDKILQGDAKAMQYMPLAGKLWYYWLGGGLEEFETKQLNKELEEE